MAFSLPLLLPPSIRLSINHSIPTLASSFRRAPRRLFLALCACSLLMDAGVGGGGRGRGGGRTLIASGRIRASPPSDRGYLEKILKNVEWHEKFSFKDEDFARLDEWPDTDFYWEPRFVMHMDDPAIAALTKYYEKVTVDCLTKPLDVFKEMQQILKPGASNLCFFTKSISIWTSTADVDHAWIVGAHFHYAGGFEPPVAVDISPNSGRSDPMYVVYFRKQSTS